MYLHQTEDVILKIFILIKGKNESKTLAKRISSECRCAFDGRTCNSKQKWNNDKCYFECKKMIKNFTCEKESTQNPSTCECQCNKYCVIGE